MEIYVSQAGDVLVVQAFGEIDAAAAEELQTRIADLTAPGSRLVLDMSGVSSMSSAGLRLLLLLYRQVNETGGQIVLCGASEDIVDTMSATGFLDFFAMYDTVDAGLEALG
jgi:anti-sigma B factor antagonist